MLNGLPARGSDQPLTMCAMHGNHPIILCIHTEPIHKLTGPQTKNRPNAKEEPKLAPAAQTKASAHTNETP